MDADRICEASAQYADKMLEEWSERVEGEAPGEPLVAFGDRRDDDVRRTESD